MNRDRVSRFSAKTVVVLLLLWAAAPSPARAQDVAAGEAIATVMAALSITAVQPLNFGNVYQGVAKSQDENDDLNSGIFQILGANSAGISLYIALPAYLALPDGSDRLIVAFSITDCTIDTMALSPSTVTPADGWADVDPHNLPNGLVVGTGGQTNVYLGGKVIPSVDQEAGNYAGDIIASVAYNGT